MSRTPSDNDEQSAFQRDLALAGSWPDSADFKHCFGGDYDYYDYCMYTYYDDGPWPDEEVEVKSEFPDSWFYPDPHPYPDDDGFADYGGTDSDLDVLLFGHSSRLRFTGRYRPTRRMLTGIARLSA